MIDWYLALKIVHIFSACILFGTGLGTAFYMLVANRTKDLAIIATATGQVVKADWLFTTTSGIVQALTGFSMAFLHGFPISTPWLFLAILAYAFAGLCWLPVVYFQTQLHEISQACYLTKSTLPKQYYQYYRYWFILGWPAFISLIFVYYLMVAKPLLHWL